MNKARRKAGLSVTGSELSDASPTRMELTVARSAWHNSYNKVKRLQHKTKGKVVSRSFRVLPRCYEMFMSVSQWDTTFRTDVIPRTREHH